MISKQEHFRKEKIDTGWKGLSENVLVRRLDCGGDGGSPAMVWSTVGRNQQSMGAARPLLQRSSGLGCTSAGSELSLQKTS